MTKNRKVLPVFLIHTPALSANVSNPWWRAIWEALANRLS